MSKAEAETQLYVIQETGRRKIGFTADIQNSFTKKFGYGTLCGKLETLGTLIHIPDIGYKCSTQVHSYLADSRELVRVNNLALSEVIS